MDTAGLRELLLGEPPRTLLNALLLGSFAAIPIVWLAEMLREHFVTPVFWMAFLATACLVLVATAILLCGGLRSAILAVFPVVSLAIFAGVLGVPDNLVLEARVIGALLVAALVGSAGYLLVKWLVRVASEPTDDTRPLDRVTRRQLLLGGVGSATIVGIGVLDEPWRHRCEESPADCRIRVDDWVPIEISVQVAQDGTARFSTREELGGRNPTASYAEVLPIGCSRPQVLDVTVETDVGGTTSERVAFEEPASTAGALAGATLAITATRAEIEMIAEYDYGPVE